MKKILIKMVSDERTIAENEIYLEYKSRMKGEEKDRTGINSHSMDNF